MFECSPRNRQPPGPTRNPLSAGPNVSWWDVRYARHDRTGHAGVNATAATIRTLTVGEFRARLAELVALYVSAMRYPDGILSARVALWDEHSHRAGFASVIAQDEGGEIRGVSYGYRGQPGQWWYSEVDRGLGPNSGQWLTDFFELTELHVRPDSQGAGLGQALLTTLLTARPEGSVLLSTPEGTNRAWRLYRRMGFVDVLREYRFTGDPRPFGVLGRPLPLQWPEPDPST